MMKIAGTALGLALLAGVAAPAYAQTAKDIELTRAQIQTARQAIIADAMKLTDDESLTFWPAYRDYRLEMARLGDRLVKVITEFASTGATLNDEQATRLLDEYLDIRAKDVSVKQKYVRVFRKLLPAPKVTRFFQLENKLDAVVNFDLARTIPLTR
jgi:hypothetical protein